MPYLPQGVSSEYTLHVGGFDVLPHINVDENPITWDDEASNTIGSMSFRVYDANPAWADRLPLRTGMEVVFKRSTGQVIFGGTLVSMTHSRAIVGRYTDCQVVSYDAWLDWRQVPRWNNYKDSKRKRYYYSDKQAVKAIMAQRAPMFYTYPYVDETTGSTSANRLEKGFKVEGVSLRGALEEIAEEANYNGKKRKFYIDYHKRLHWYADKESSNPSPFNATDQEYAALVTGHANNVEYWPMTEADIGTAYGRQGALDLDSITANAVGARLVPNQPGKSRSNNGSTTEISSTADGGATLTCSGGWAYEFWVSLDTLAANARLLLTYEATEDGPEIWVQTDGDIQLQNRGDASATTWVAGLAINTVYHIVVGQTSGGTNYCRVNGVDQGAGTGTATLCGDQWASFIPVTTTNPFTGDVGHAAWYTGDGLTAAECLAHYYTGLAINPEYHNVTDDGAGEVHKVYVRGSNAKGSGWVGPLSEGKGDWDWPKQEYITRRKSKTARKRNRTGRNYLKQRDNVFSGAFTITDPDHAIGWRSGQTVEITDAALGAYNTTTDNGTLAATTVEVAAVRGEYAGNAVRIDIEYGTIKRSLLREWRV